MRPAVAILDDYGGRACGLADWSAVERHARLDFLDGPITQADAALRLADYDIICLTRERTALPGVLIAALPRLRAIVTTGRVTANLDLEAARSRKIRVVAADLSGAGGGASDVVEVAWGLILSLLRNIVAQSQSVQAGGWQLGPGRSLRGMTLGLLGFGRVGQAMVPVAHALGMHVAAWSPSLSAAAAREGGAELLSREHIFERSDVISLHLPVTPATRGSIGHKEFLSAKPGAVLINTSRGAVLDHVALIDALRQGRLAGAALDVFDEEPIPAFSALRAQPNLLLTPHIGFATEQGLATMYNGMISSLLKLIG